MTAPPSAGSDDDAGTRAAGDGDRGAVPRVDGENGGGPVREAPESAGDSAASDGAFWQWRSREVEVPLRVYKTVTVFATLIAVASVLAGFVLLDRATNRAQLAPSDVDAVVALLGVGTIVFGAAVYAYSTRFRAAGMGKPNSDGGEADDDG